MPSNENKRIELTAKDTAETAVAQIKTEAAPLIILLADHDAILDPTVTSLCSRAILPAALDSNTIIIDNGPVRGSIGVAIQAARDEGQSPLVIYVQAHPQGTADSGYPIHIQLPPEWPNRIKAVFQIAAGLVRVDQKSIDKPAVTVLIGGGNDEKDGLVRSVRRGWPILLMEGSGGVADEILKAMKPAPDGTPPPPSADPAIREIIETASIDSFLISGNADDLHRILMARVDQRVNTLADSWSRFDELDAEAIHKRETSRRLQALILVLGVVATLRPYCNPAKGRRHSRAPLHRTELSPAWDIS